MANILPLLSAPFLSSTMIVSSATAQVGTIFHSIERILDYKVRIREIDAQIYRIEKEAEVMMHRITAEHDIVIARLQVERDKSLKQFEAYVTQQQVIEHSRRDISKAILTATRALVDPAVSEEVKQTLPAMLAELRLMMGDENNMQVQLFQSFIEGNSESRPLLSLE